MNTRAAIGREGICLLTIERRPVVKKIGNGAPEGVGLEKIITMAQKNREAWLDWLRILAVLGVLFYHSAMPFVPDEQWHIKNNETSHLLMEFNFWLSRFRMPLLFFISGCVTFVMLQKRTSGQFIGLRFRRLLIPLAFGMLTIVPIQVYLERVNQGYKGNFFSFYPSIFTTGTYPKGNFSWHHLWFIAYLFVYDVALAPVFKWVIVNKDKWSVKFLAAGRRIYLLVLLPVLILVGLVFRFPQTNDLVHDWCWFFYWLSFVLMGFVCMTFPTLMESLMRNRRVSLSLALVTILAINYLRWNQLEPHNFFSDVTVHWQTYVYIGLMAATACFWVFSALGYGRAYLNKPRASLQYFNKAVYPFYILHQTIIVVLAFYVTKVSESILMKYLFLVIVTFVISMLVYHLFIRPFGVMRLLFGVKEEKKSTPEKKAAEVRRPAGVLAAAMEEMG